MTIRLGDDPRDASLPDSVVTHLSRMRRLDRGSYDVMLQHERANVDRMREAETRTRLNRERRAERYLSIDCGLPAADVQEIADIMRAEKVDATTAAVILGQRRAEAK